MSEPVAASLVLPSALITRADLARLVREIESVDNEIEAQKARNHTTGKKEIHMPGVSQGLNDFAELNKLDLTDDQSRMLVKEQMKAIKDKAPVIHLTFATEADQMSLKQLVEYIRGSLHPQALLHVGLQPALVGGVYMRTPNHVHDFSIRAKLAQSRGVIQQDIDQLLRAVPVAGTAMGPAVMTGVVPVVEMPAEVAQPAAHQPVVAQPEPAAARPQAAPPEPQPAAVPAEPKPEHA